MKLHKLELRSVDIGDKEPLTYAGLVKTVISTPGQGGLSCDEMLTAVQIQAALAGAATKDEKYLLLSDEHYKFLKARLDAFRWGAAHPALADFILHVRDLPLTDVKATT